MRRVRRTATPCKTRRALSRRLRRAGADGAWDDHERGGMGHDVKPYNGGLDAEGPCIGSRYLGTPATVKVCGRVWFLFRAGQTYSRKKLKIIKVIKRERL